MCPLKQILEYLVHRPAKANPISTVPHGCVWLVVDSCLVHVEDLPTICFLVPQRNSRRITLGNLIRVLEKHESFTFFATV